MAEQAKSGFIGLYTNAAETMVPAGGLLEAENVVIRRPGCVEARDGVTRVGAVGGGYAAWGYSWRGKDYYARNNGSNVFDWHDTGVGTFTYADLVLGSISPQPMRRDVFSRAEARANFYLPYDSGVLKMSSDSDTAWSMAGLPPYAQVASATAVATGSVWLTDPGQVAYRVVTKRTDANGVVVRSTPSGAIIVKNNGAGTSIVRLVLVAASTTLSLFDEVEVYRTRTFTLTVAPDDEMQLVAVVPSQAGMAAAAGLTFDDAIPPTGRGAVIYTAPSRGGIAKQNDRPPAAACVAPFRGSVFFGNVRGPARTKFTRKWSGVIATATGIGQRNVTGDIAVGTNTILNVVPTTGLERGMVLGTAAGTEFPVNTYITAISGTTVTVSQNSAATTVGLAISFVDAINVGGVWLPGFNADAYVGFYLAGKYVATSVTPPETGQMPGGTPGDTGTCTYVIESLSRASATHQIKATHGGEYSPVLPTFAATAKNFDQDTWPGAIYWSKTDEPEHVAPGNYAFVGDQKKAVLGLVPTRDALFILKEDGVFRLTGSGGEWRIDPFDPNCFCVLPMSVQNLNGRAVFLSAEGVVALDDGGVQLISRPVNDQVKLTIDQVLSNWRSTSFYEVNGSQGASYSAVFDRENEYALMRSTSDAHLVYNADTSAWTTWKYYAHASESITPRAVFGWSRRGTVAYALSSDYYETILSTAAGASYSRYDRVTAITVNSYAGGLAALSSSVTALEDDVIEDSSDRFWRVTADVNASASVPVALGGGIALMATGPAFLYRALRCHVVTAGYTEPGGMQKIWGAVTAAFTRLQGAVRVRWGYRSSQSATWVEEDARTALTEGGATGSGYTDYELGAAPVAHVPRAHKMAWLLRLRMRWVQAFGDVRLEGLTTAFEPRSVGSRGQVEP